MIVTDVNSIEEYLVKYYRRDRITPTLVESYKEELAEHGFVCTSKHDNVTGEMIFWGNIPQRIVDLERRKKHENTFTPHKIGS